MDIEELTKFLEKNYSKAGTLYLTKLVLDDELKIQQILKLCRHDNQKILFRASWLLEHVACHYPDSFKVVLRDFLLYYPHQTNESAQRCFSKILMSITHARAMRFYGLSYIDLEDCLSASFDWLIKEETPLAIKCNCMDIIFQLHEYEEWIKAELKIVLEKIFCQILLPYYPGPRRY